MVQRREHTWWHKARAALGSERDDAQAELASDIVREARRLEWVTLDRAQDIVDNYCLYGHFGAWGVSDQLVVQEQPLRRNMIATGVDTVCSELLQDNPRAMFISRGGTWSDRRTARKLTSWGDDIDDEQQLDDIRPQYYRDGFIAGTGWVYPYRDGDNMRTDRVFPANVLLDDRGGSDAAPRQLFLRRFVDRFQLEVIAEELGCGEQVLERVREAPDAGDSIWAFADNDPGSRCDLVEVWEGWRLGADCDCDKDEGHCERHCGIHVIAIDGAVLSVEPYSRQRYPLVPFRPLKPTQGFWGISLVGRAGPLQLALNDQLERIDEAQEHHAHGALVVPPGSETLKQHWTNQAGIIVEHPNPGLINWLAPEPMPESAYRHRDWLKDAILEEFAVNEMQAQGTKPSGLDSGKALRVFVDTGSRRYLDMKRAAGRSHCEYMRAAVAIQRAIANDNTGHKVVYKRYGVPVEIEWSKLDLDDKRCRIVPFPSTALPNDPAGRLQALEEMRKDGAISQEDYWAMADVPDLESARDEYTAPTEFIRYQLDTILDDGRYEGPWPNLPLDRAMQIANATLFKEALHGCPEEKLDLIRQYMGECQHWIEAAQPPPAPGPMPGMPMDPMAAGVGGPVPPMDPELPPGMGPMGPGMPPPIDPLAVPQGPLPANMPAPVAPAA